MPSWVLIGCGYVGTKLARRLVGRGEDVTIARRDPEEVTRIVNELGVRGVRADLELPATLAGIVPPDAIVVCLAPPGKDPAAEIGALLAAARVASRIVYVSSTGVYAPGKGEWVDEGWPVEPVTTSGKARLAAEQALAAAEVPCTVLRVAGIYAADRGLAPRIRDGSYRIVGDGTSHVSRIHVADLITAIIAAGEGAVNGVVNVADDDPAPIGEVADAVAGKLGQPPPPRVLPDSVSPEISGMLTADRRIANRRLKQELGVTLAYPSWRDAF
ncbi:MAG TPA: NAD(P)H-binding protein [Kofleriaceae bacterium]